MITDLKNRVTKEVLLRNVEIVEKAISTYLNIKSHSNIVSELEKLTQYIDSNVIYLPIKSPDSVVAPDILICGKVEIFPCSLISHLKDVECDEKTSSYKTYINNQYKELNKNLNLFLKQDFQKLGHDKSFVEKVKKGLNSIKNIDDATNEFYEKVNDKLRIMQIIQFNLSLENWQEEREDAFSYWDRDSLVGDFNRSALSDLQWMKECRDNDTRIKW